MAIKSMIIKAKNWFLFNEREIVLVSAFLLISAISFGLGILWQKDGETKAPIVINKSKLAFADKDTNIRIGTNKISSVANILYIASKNGTSYHLPSCPGAKQIKPENKIEFKSKEEAESRGYKPASNCPGLLQ